MNGTARPRHAAGDIPDFLVKTTLGCSIVVILILIPFTVNNFIQGRVLMGAGTSAIAAACVLNVWYGIRGRYNLAVNLWFMAPAGGFTITYTLIKLTHAGSYWPVLLVLAYYFVLPERRAWFLNVLTLLVIIPVAWFVLDHSSAVRFAAVLVGVSLFAFISMREINVLHGLMRRDAVTDKLTGLFNRVLLEDRLEEAIAQSQRTGVPMALLAFDVDLFKSINDSLGHDTGDLVLEGLGDLLRGRIRGTDVAFRVGGEEFLVLLHNADEKKGAEVAEDLRREVECARLLEDRQVTISVGVSGLREDMDAAAWVKAGDERLYRAKEAGRNRVVT